MVSVVGILAISVDCGMLDAWGLEYRLKSFSDGNMFRQWNCLLSLIFGVEVASFAILYT